MITDEKELKQLVYQFMQEPGLGYMHLNASISRDRKNMKMSIKSDKDDLSDNINWN